MTTYRLDASAIPNASMDSIGLGVSDVKWRTLVRRSAESMDRRLPCCVVVNTDGSRIQSVEVTWYYALRSGEQASPLTTGIIAATQVHAFLPLDSLTGQSNKIIPLDLSSTDALRAVLLEHGFIHRSIPDSVEGMTEAQIVANMRFGFELETQATEGASECGDNDMVLDETAWDQAIDYAERLIANDPSEWRYYIPSLGTVDLNGVAVEAHDRNNWRDIIRATTPSSVFDLVGRGILTQHQARMAARNFRADARATLNEADYQVEKNFQWFEGQYASRFADYDLVIGSDGSVDGFEFRTDGGQTAARFMEQSQFIFGLNHDIDTRCSFHLHVSINRDEKQIPFKFDQKVKAAATEYLISQMANVPRAVRTRWADNAAGEYFAPTLQHEKYSFVHAHSFGTLEYRCFGNVTNATNAEVCLELATKATLHAIKVLKGEATTLLATEYDGDEEAWEDAMTLHLSRGTACTLPSLPVAVVADALPATEPASPVEVVTVAAADVG